MADTGGRIRFQFDGDLTGLQRSLTQATTMARNAGKQMGGQFASGLGAGGRGALGGGAGGFEEGIVSAFTKQRGAVRAERVLGRTINQLMSGDIAGAVGTVGGKIGGVGIGTVLGIDAAIQGYQKLSAAMDAIQERRLKFTELTSGTGATGLLRSSGEIQSNLSGVADQMAVLQKGFLEERLDPMARLKGQFTHTERMDEMAGLRAQASSDITAMANRQDKLNEAEAESLFGSKRKAELLKEQEKHTENIYQIAKDMARTGVTNPAAMNAENERNRLTEEGINRQGDLAQAAQESSIRMAELHKERPFDTGELKRAGIQEKLGLISKEMGGPMTTERREALSAERLGLESEEEVSEFEETQKTPRQKAREKRLQSKFEAFRRKRAGPQIALGLQAGGLTTGGLITGGVQGAGAGAFDMLGPLGPGEEPGAKGRAAVAAAKAEQDRYKPLTFEEMDRIFQKYLGPSQ